VRVLFSSTFGYGHMFPMYPLARAFLAAGHDILWATSADARDRLEAAGLPAAPSGLAGPELRERVGSLQARVASVSPRERAAFMYPRLFGETLTPPMAADLLPLATRWRPDLMVHEHGELASPLVGRVLQVPSVTHAFGGGIPPSMLEDAGARLAGLWAEHGQALPPYAGSFTTLYLDICPPSVQSVPLDHVPARQPLRPVADAGAATGPLPHYLERDERPLVYVTLGTVQNRLPLLAPAVSALARLPVRVLVTVGPDGDPDALGPQPDHVHVERWVDQPRVLQHCDVVVSHAGSGTFLGALAEGLPQLCLPQAADQFRNSEGAARAGVAVVLHPDESSPETIASAVGRLLTDEALHRRARGVADEIAAMPSPDDVVDRLLTTFGGGA
jgi:UDP:flavonoid glycosyltransferase YjiC (YdhE family)